MTDRVDVGTIDDPWAWADKPAKLDVRQMSVHGDLIAARLRNVFRAYQDRPDADNRGAQVRMGPSQIGTPCDRKIAMHIAGAPGHGDTGEKWAAFLGTAAHAALADMYLWRNGDAVDGRYLVEQRVSLPSKHCPGGTADLIDRQTRTVVDYKVLSRWSMNKIRTLGPSENYRIQVHLYAYGARILGEDIEHVAIAALPKESATLDGLYVWSEPYDGRVARLALARLERIALDVGEGRPVGTFAVADDCKFCPYHDRKGDNTLEGGCNGRQ